MERKNYLVEELNSKEKLYLKKCIVSVRNRYYSNHYARLNCFEELNSNILVESKSALDSLWKKEESELMTLCDFENSIEDEIIRKKVKALPLRERTVFFYCYKDEEEINKIARKMKLHRNSIRKIRDRAINKIRKGI